MKYSGTCFLEDGTGRSATFDIAKEGEHWVCVVKHAGSRHEDKSLQPAPWPLLDKLTDEAFKASIPASDAPRWDTSRKIKPPPLRRRRFNVQGYRDRTENREETP
jgi:hypothetical protein